LGETALDVLENRDEWKATYEANWLAHLRATGQADFKRYNRPKNSTAPTGPGIDLVHSRLVLISSAGGYLRDSQTLFDDGNLLGAYDIRVFRGDIPLAALAFAHTHYDHTAVDQDPQVLVPLRHLEDLQREGVIGKLAENVISFMGYQPDVERVLDETIPAIVTATRAERADAALLVPA
jgi:D-proline reductase (dithiol) PrdB